MSIDGDALSSEQILGSDYALGRVPKAARYSWLSMALEQMAQGGCIANVVMGAQIGHKMTFADAALAVIVGNSILAAISIAVGMIGCYEGMTTSMLCLWSGLGVVGSGVLSILSSASLFGWFGIQAAIAGNGLEALAPVWPAWAWTIANGALVTVIVSFGFRWMVGTSWITGPIFFVVTVWACIIALQSSELRKHEVQTSHFSLLHGTGVVVGGWVVGSVLISDALRFARSKRQVVTLVLLPRSCSIATYMLSGVLLAQAYHTEDVIAIMQDAVGLGAVVIVVAGEMVINCANIYSATLAILAFFDMTWGCRLPRPLVTMVSGLVGSTLGALGILKSFSSFLSLLAVTFPPVAGLICCEYLLVKAFRAKLEETRGAGALPTTAPGLVLASLLAWALAVLVGHVADFGAPYLYSLFVSALLYGVAGRLGWLQSCGVVKMAKEPSSSFADIDPPR